MGLVGIPQLIKIVERRWIFEHQFYMKFVEDRNDDTEGCEQAVTQNPHNRMIVQCRSWFLHDRQDNLNEVHAHEAHHQDDSQDDVRQKKHKEFSIGKSNAVTNPWTVMIHVQYAPLTRRTVVTSDIRSNLPFRFEAVAQQTIPPFFGLFFFKEETPIDRDSAWIRNDALHHAPQQHEQTDMEEDECQSKILGADTEHVLKDEQVVRKADEQDDSKEVRTEHPPAADFPNRHLKTYSEHL